MEMRKTPEEVQNVLDYYGASLDDSGEPDEAPDEESVVTLPTPEEEEQRQREWAGKVSAWRKERGSVHDFPKSAGKPRRACQGFN